MNLFRRLKQLPIWWHYMTTPDSDWSIPETSYLHEWPEFRGGPIEPGKENPGIRFIEPKEIYKMEITIKPQNEILTQWLKTDDACLEFIKAVDTAYKKGLTFKEVWRPILEEKEKELNKMAETKILRTDAIRALDNVKTPSSYGLSQRDKEEIIERLENNGLIHDPAYQVILIENMESAIDLSKQYVYYALSQDGKEVKGYDDLDAIPYVSSKKIPESMNQFLGDHRADIVLKRPTSRQIDKALNVLNNPGGTWSLTHPERQEAIDRLYMGGLITVERLYNIQLDPENDESYVNLFKGKSPEIKLADAGETPSLQTRFTAEEIENNPILKALESHKVEVK